MNIITRRQRVDRITYDFAFDRGDGSGFGFDCDANGVVDVSKLTEMGAKNYNILMKAWEQSGRASEFEAFGETFAAPYVRKFHNSYVAPAIGICDDCGHKVELHGFTNTCECGADYNSSGQRLGPRENWGEETGESLTDILNIP